MLFRSEVGAAAVIGGVAGLIGYFGVIMRPKTGLDDALDVFAVHGMGGIWGSIATGIFAVAAVGGEGKGGLLDGNPAQLGVQVMGVVATLVYSGVVSFIILKVLDVVMGLRPDEHTEAQGLDITAHGERAYVGDGAD